MRAVTEFNISVIVGTKMMLGMHDRSAECVLHFAILALLKIQQTLKDYFH